MPANATTRRILRLARSAAAARDAGDPDVAVRDWLRCIELDDGSDAGLRGDPDLPPFRLRPYLSYADHLRRRGDPAGAVKVLDYALACWPWDADVHALLGLCYRELHDWERAAPALQRSVELRQSADICVLLAHTLERLDRRDEAHRWLVHAVAVDPGHEESHYNLGCVYERAGDVDAAIDAFGRATALDPAYAIAHARLGALVFHRALHRVPQARDHADFTLAFDHLSRATALDPADGWSHARLATLCEVQGRLDDAVAHHRAATLALPDVPAVWSNHGNLLSQRGADDAEAERLLRLAVALAPDDERARYWLGKHLWYVGDDAGARAELQHADRLGHPGALAWLSQRDSEPAGDDDDGVPR